MQVSPLSLLPKHQKTYDMSFFSTSDLIYSPLVDMMLHMKFQELGSLKNILRDSKSYWKLKADFFLKHKMYTTKTNAAY